MDTLYKYRKNCYKFSYSRDQYMEEWVNNQTIDTIIEVALLEFTPYVIFTKINELIFEWCGTTLIYAEYFGKFSKTR